MIDAKGIEALIAPSLAAMGFRLVRVVFTGTGGNRATLQIMAEHADDSGMTVDDCSEISNAVSALLDVADPVPGAYVLEVSSPGIDRPLLKPEDYQRFAGFEAKIDLARPVEGRKRYRGRLLGLEGGAAKLRFTDKPKSEEITVLLPLDAIQRAKLVLTDDLIAATNPVARS